LGAANHNRQSPAIPITRPLAKRGTTTSPVIMPAPKMAKTSGVRLSGMCVTVKSVSAR
jgi:hypothetical protein